MSKKIKIYLNDKNRPNLSILFHKYLENCGNNIAYYNEDDYYDELAKYWDSIFPGWDDDSDVIYPRRKHNKDIDITTPYSGEEDDPMEYWDDESAYKQIWFYPDYHDKYDRLEFNSIKKFDEYCASMGYSVPKYVESDLVWRVESHCCLNPLSEKDGILEVLSEHSYGEMFYEACDVSELSQ